MPEKVYSIRELIARLQDLREDGHSTLSESKINVTLLDPRGPTLREAERSEQTCGLCPGNR